MGRGHTRGSSRVGSLLPGGEIARCAIEGGLLLWWRVLAGFIFALGSERFGFQAVDFLSNV